MQPDYFWGAVKEIEQQSKRKKKNFQSTGALLNDIQSDDTNSTDSSAFPSPTAMRQRYQKIVNANKNNNDTTNSSIDSTPVLINQSSLISTSSSSPAPIQPSSSSPSQAVVAPCCSNSDKYHKFTLSPDERDEIIAYLSNGTIPASKTNPQRKQAFIKYCNKYSLHPISINGVADIQIKCKKIDYHKTSDNKIISEKKARSQNIPYYTSERQLIVPKCKRSYWAEFLTRCLFLKILAGSAPLP